MCANTRIVSLKMPMAMIDALERLVELKLYPSRSEAIKAAVRDLLRKELGRW